MKLKILILLMILTSLCHVYGQEKKWSPSDYKDLSFKEFVASAQALLKVKFFYKDEWVKELKLGAYPEKYSLSDLLTELLRGTSLYFYFDKRGNVILTKDFAIKVSDNSDDEESRFIPPSDYSTPEDNQQKAGNTFVEIGNPAERYKEGKVIISGYITDSDTKEPLAGTTIFNQKLYGRSCFK